MRIRTNLLQKLLVKLKHKWESYSYQNKLAVNWKTIIFPKDLRKSLHEELSNQLKLINSSTDSYPSPTELDKRVIESISAKTKQMNRNNVTRTEAYRQFYLKHPEIHWALLAHMVSRNGGWNMTDLKSEFIPRLLDSQERYNLFLFLERANALIFHDAYPQLLLYEKSLQQSQNLFHLLPIFKISAFMKPFWDLFLQTKQISSSNITLDTYSRLLTIALIINEQHYIEGRVVQHPFYQENVLNTLHMKSQGLLQLNQIILPYDLSKDYFTKKEELKKYEKHKIRLAGLVMEDFSDIDERILIGKGLYALLFGVPTLHQGVVRFIKENIHTGSRSDYWPHLFTQFSSPLNYSPKLEEVWKDHPMKAPEEYDWFTDLKPLTYMKAIKTPSTFEITSEHYSWLDRLEIARRVKETFQ